MSKRGVFSGPYFPIFGLNTEIYRVNLRIQSEYRKIRIRKNSVFGHFSRSDNLRPTPDYYICCWFILHYADDTIPYVFRFSFEETIDILESTIQKVSVWFTKNKLIIKFFVFVGAYEKINLKISDSFIISNRSAELFKIVIWWLSHISWAQQPITFYIKPKFQYFW